MCQGRIDELLDEALKGFDQLVSEQDWNQLAALGMHLAIRDLALPPLPPGAPPEAHAERERLIAIYELPAPADTCADEAEQQADQERDASLPPPLFTVHWGPDAIPVQTEQE
mgnify:CR=1 FL=1